MVTVLLAGFSIVTGLVTIWAGTIQYIEYRTSRVITRTKEFPVRIKRPISNRDYWKVLDQFRAYLGECRVAADIVVAVHYGGLRHAADVAKHLLYYRPVRHVEVELQPDDRNPICQAITPCFPLEDLSGKRVLVVDNSIRSGRTLSMVVEKLQPHARSITTCVMHKAESDGRLYEPDITVFESTAALRDLFK